MLNSIVATAISVVVGWRLEKGWDLFKVHLKTIGTTGPSGSTPPTSPSHQGTEGTEKKETEKKETDVYESLDKIMSKFEECIMGCLMSHLGENKGNEGPVAEAVPVEENTRNKGGEPCAQIPPVRSRRSEEPPKHRGGDIQSSNHPPTGVPIYRQDGPPRNPVQII